MITTQIPHDFLKLLANEVRWQLLEALAESDRRVQELVSLLQRPQNLVSYHLRLLREGQLINERHSSADGRDIYYSLDLAQLSRKFQATGQTLHPGIFQGLAVQTDTSQDNEKAELRPFRVLFLCTHNSARSQLAEGILRAKGGSRVEVFSAGSIKTHIHPLAIEAAAKLQIDISGQYSKHMDEFKGQHFDYVITVCDKVKEVCPVYPESQKIIHWSLEDPSEVTGTEEEKINSFLKTARELSTRINYLLFVI